MSKMKVDVYVAKGWRLAYMKLTSFIQRKNFIGFTTFNRSFWVVEKYKHDRRLMAHEFKHIEQIEKLGRFKFLFKYLWQNITKGYYKNSFEVEARAAEHDPEKQISKYEIKYHGY